MTSKTFKNPLTNREVKYLSKTHKELIRNKVEGVPLPEGYKITTKGYIRKVEPTKKLGRPTKKAFTSELTVLGSDLGFTTDDFMILYKDNKVLSHGYKTEEQKKSELTHTVKKMLKDFVKYEGVENIVKDLKGELERDINTVKVRNDISKQEKRDTINNLKNDFKAQSKSLKKQYKVKLRNFKQELEQYYKKSLKDFKKSGGNEYNIQYTKRSKEENKNEDLFYDYKIQYTKRSQEEKNNVNLFYADSKTNPYLNRIKAYLKNNLPKGKTYRIAYYYKPLGGEHFKKFYEIPESFVVPQFNGSTGFSSWWNKSNLGKYFYYAGYNLLESMRNKIKLDYYGGDKEEAEKHALDISDVLDNVKIVFVEGSNIKPKKLDQFFRDGLEKHCFLQPIYEWAVSLLEGKTSKTSIMRYKRIIKIVEQYIKEYDGGFPQDKIQKLCDDIRVNISVELPFECGSIVNIVGNRDKIRSFKFRNTRLNHVELDEVTYQGNEEYVTQEKLKELEAEFVEKGIFYELVMGKNGLLL